MTTFFIIFDNLINKPFAWTCPSSFSFVSLFLLDHFNILLRKHIFTALNLYEILVLQEISRFKSHCKFGIELSSFFPEWKLKRINVFHKHFFGIKTRICKIGTIGLYLFILLFPHLGFTLGKWSLERHRICYTSVCSTQPNFRQFMNKI